LATHGARLHRAGHVAAEDIGDRGIFRLRRKENRDRGGEHNKPSLCINPASLRGGAATLDPIIPTAPFAPTTTIGIATGLVGFPRPSPPASTPWYEARGAYSGLCSPADEADVLQITPVGGAPDLNAIRRQLGPSPDRRNIALGNLVDLVRQQIAAYAKRRHG
jgi:hypothetical protein